MLVNRYNYQSLLRTNEDGTRKYQTPDGNKLVSVTTILDKTKSAESKEALNNWKKRVGSHRAKQITAEAASRGTRMHDYLEHFIKTDDMKPFPKNPYAQVSWFMASKIILDGLKHVNEAWGVEASLYSSGLYAGTTDCVGEWKGKPAIIDFKQTNKPKKVEWIEDYFLQLCAYAVSHNEMFGTDIRTGAILMCVKPDETIPNSEPTYQEFVIEGDAFDFWKSKWFDRVEQYYRLC